ncbi:MAG: DUF559 domain-containing protein [Clostridia bacterium]|nr:DUF559 domain-containing protein [Clostridia bacterium]
MLPYNKRHIGNARAFRKKMTPEEQKLWFNLLKRLPIRVKRQFCISDYIVDFYIPSVKIVIEIDGKQHLTQKHKEKDKIRDSQLASFDISVLRYNNESINCNFNAVAKDILEKLSLTFDDLKPIA